MKHLILCREFPPAVYPPGGIGTYAAHIAHAMAERGETVHVIGERWEGAAKRTEQLCDGRLIVHRIAPEDAVLYPELSQGGDAQETVNGMVKCPFPPHRFSWVAAGLAERLVEQEGIDVIEAQEWEAPLHYFLLRRTMGLGPDRKPPCITHLHSPTEFIFQHNGWSLARPDYVPMKRMEDHVIRAADGWLCPSRFLADQATGHYGLDGPVEVIPLPLGTTKKIERRAAKWKSGSIVFCGRLEPRKGIIEFVEAAVSIAREMPELRFDFIGSDTEYDDRTNVGEVLDEMIPPELKRNFRFHGSKPRTKLLKMLGDARIAVVPSRWENFPNTCLEAMCSGLPVLASRNGGMAEMIEHGVTGWLAADGAEPLANRLADALRIAVKTPAEQLRQMGDAAAISIHRLCDNDAIVARHVAYREEIRRKGAERSLHPADAPLSYPDVSASELVPDTTGRYEIQGFASVLSLPLRDQAKIWLLALRRPDWAVRWLYWRGKSFMESKWGADARH